MLKLFNKFFICSAICIAMSACRLGSEIAIQTVEGITTFKVTAPSCVRVISVTQNPETMSPKYSYSLQTALDNRQNQKHCRYSFTYGKSYPGYEMQYDEMPLKPGVPYFVEYSGASFRTTERFMIP
jgi:hypothetical protein